MKDGSAARVIKPSHGLMEEQVVKVHGVLDDGRIQVLACGIITTVSAGDVEPFTIED